MLEKPKILIVDDRPENLIALERVLGDFEVEFVRADSGNQALALTLEHELALALIDVQMPEMDGYETVELMRQEKKTANLPVIFVSAVYSGDYYKIRGVEVGAVDFIEKPIVPELLRGKVKIFLQLYEQRREIEKFSDELAAKVAEKTADLVARNQQLKEEMEQRHKLQARMRRAQKMEAIGTMSGGIAHEFNNILAIVTSYAELALENEAAGEPVKEELGVVLDAAARATKLIRQILTFSRQGEQSPTLVNPASQLKELAPLLRATIPSTVEIKMELDENYGPIRVDTTQLNQVLINLCNNAAQAMNNKGLIDIALQKVELSAEILQDHPGLAPGRYVEIIVGDNGPGVDARIVDSIFDPFFTTKAVGQGTGMGLSVVQGIVEQHKGLIQVENRRPHGALFHVFLPLAEPGSPPIAAVATASPVSSPVHDSHRIMVIDDEAAIVRVTTRTLEKNGYQVSGFCDSRVALAAFAAEPEAFDLIITDQTMPGFSGQDLAQKIHALRPGMPVVVSSGLCDTMVAEARFATDFSAYIRKPFSKNDLLTTLSAILKE
ncbi:MAG: response regulator [Deltaproteobacteria bacterium]|nr:response regulator [Deltaproteobacteria bacterium]